MTGYLRVTSFRAGAENGPEPDETVIDMDRSHAVLGNRHVMRNRSLAERERVIAAHAVDLDADFQRQGSMFSALLAIAERVAAGEKICGRCWCAPLPCHVDNYVIRVRALVADLESRSAAAATAEEEVNGGRLR